MARLSHKLRRRLLVICRCRWTANRRPNLGSTATGSGLVVRGGIAKMLYAHGNHCESSKFPRRRPFPCRVAIRPYRKRGGSGSGMTRKRSWTVIGQMVRRSSRPAFGPNLITATMSCRLIGCFLAVVGTAGGMAGRGEWSEAARHFGISRTAARVAPQIIVRRGRICKRRRTALHNKRALQLLVGNPIVCSTANVDLYGSPILT
jgi:hypothetical protein